MKLSILGAPGSGKGTQAQKIAKHYNLKHIVMGNIIKREIWDNTELGKIMYEYTKDGKFVPNDIIIRVLDKELQNLENYNGFIIDTAPINMEQKVLMTDIALDAVISMDIQNYNIVRERTMSRLICTTCMAVSSNKDTTDKVCAVCGGKLEPRYDDSVVVVDARIEQFKRETVPVLREFDREGKLISVNAENSRDVVFDEIITKLDNFFGKTTLN
ncbi:MAG: nucleoside monophosphate kinase [Clostridia bacterium]|nr:nucleoside monophosphate kinase [Clostridia bacterium]